MHLYKGVDIDYQTRMSTHQKCEFVLWAHHFICIVRGGRCNSLKEMGSWCCYWVLTRQSAFPDIFFLSIFTLDTAYLQRTQSTHVYATSKVGVVSEHRVSYDGSIGWAHRVAKATASSRDIADSRHTRQSLASEPWTYKKRSLNGEPPWTATSMSK